MIERATSNEAEIAALSELTVAPMVYQLYKESTFRENGCTDSRFKNYLLSLNIYEFLLPPV